MAKRRAMPFQVEMPDSPGAMIRINVGARYDIPTGVFMPGLNGEFILNGGLGLFVGLSGKGNNYKTLFLEWLMHRAGARMFYDMDTNFFTYDTEQNKEKERIHRMYRRMPEFDGHDLFVEKLYSITNKADFFLDEWVEKQKTFLELKEKNRKDLMVPTPFATRDGLSLIEIMQPTFALIDSFSEAEDKSAADIGDVEIGHKDGNMYYMRRGLGKARLLSIWPRWAMANQHYLLTAAHFGKEMMTASGPGAPMPEKILNALKPGEKIVGVTRTYNYLVHWLGLATGSSKMINDGTKGCEYPLDEYDKEKGHNDLWKVPIETLRNKYGRSSINLKMVVSQDLGVQPTLTEFDFLRESRFGLGGNNTNYYLEILPDTALSRSAARKKIDSDPVLRRALNLTSELEQMGTYMPEHRSRLMEPKEMYAKIKERGYNWEQLLSQTRGWWKPWNDNHPLKYLSTLDLLNMAHGEYHPYWMESDKITIKDKYKTEEDGTYAFN